MGTNYYGMRIPTENDKIALKKAIDNNDFSELERLTPKQIHLGKSSAGWEFLFNHNDWKYFGQTFNEVKSFIQNCAIRNEYDEDVSFEDFWQMVENKKGVLHHKKYMDEWDRIHPNQPKPSYANEETDIEVDGLRFSKWTEFS
jgi:hypothetical protein